MKSTDGKKLVKNNFYHTRSGQEVVLQDWGKGQYGPMFLITRFYEGEGTEMKLYPEGEIDFNYEHDGEIEPVDELFKEAPVFVVDKEYKEKSEEVLALCASIGKLEKLLAASNKELYRLKDEVRITALKSKDGEAALQTWARSIKSAREELADKADQIARAEEKLSSYSSPSDSLVTVTAVELAEYRRYRFKLTCLIKGGVALWEDYDEVLKDYWNQYPE
jgi:hypothetical protein